MAPSRGGLRPKAGTTLRVHPPTPQLFQVSHSGGSEAFMSKVQALVPEPQPAASHLAHVSSLWVSETCEAKTAGYAGTGPAPCPQRKQAGAAPPGHGFHGGSRSRLQSKGRPRGQRSSSALAQLPRREQRLPLSWCGWERPGPPGSPAAAQPSLLDGVRLGPGPGSCCLLHGTAAGLGWAPQQWTRALLAQDLHSPTHLFLLLASHSPEGLRGHPDQCSHSRC